MAYGSFQARGLIGAVATNVYHSHSNAGSKSSLRPRPQITATLDPLNEARNRTCVLMDASQVH